MISNRKGHSGKKSSGASTLSAIFSSEKERGGDGEGTERGEKSSEKTDRDDNKKSTAGEKEKEKEKEKAGLFSKMRRRSTSMTPVDASDDGSQSASQKPLKESKNKDKKEKK
jgi:hypothetical protein